MHHATKKFWDAYDKLPDRVKDVADENFGLLKADPFHPSLHFKKIGRYWSVRAGIQYRALGVRHEGAMIWFWIGHHSEYDRMIS
ncbi:MAG: hypothetical protein ABJQ29_05765 [Luteolibacter sp.]